MGAILKRELSSYFNSATAYVVMAVYFFFFFLFFYIYCFFYIFLSFAVVYGNMFYFAGNSKVYRLFDLFGGLFRKTD